MVDPPSMAYGKSIYDKKMVLVVSFLSYLQKKRKKRQKLHFFTYFQISKIVNISGLVIDRRNPKAPLERFIQACRYEPKFSSLSGHQEALQPKERKPRLSFHRVSIKAPQIFYKITKIFWSKSHLLTQILIGINSLTLSKTCYRFSFESTRGSNGDISVVSCPNDLKFWQMISLTSGLIWLL